MNASPRCAVCGKTSVDHAVVADHFFVIMEDPEFADDVELDDEPDFDPECDEDAD